MLSLPGLVLLLQQASEVVPVSAHEAREGLMWTLITGIGGLLTAVLTYLTHQLRERSKYKRHLSTAVEKLNNPSSRQINGNTNSAELLTYVIDDVRELRRELQEVRNQVMVTCAKKDDIRALRDTVTELARRVPPSG